MISRVIIPAVASFACASLAKQMWRSANKVAENQRAREQVFTAAQRVFPSIQTSQKEAVVNRFEQGTRAGALVAGVVSLLFAIKGLIKLI